MGKTTNALKTEQKKKGNYQHLENKKVIQDRKYNSGIPLDSAVNNIYRVIIPSRLEKEAWGLEDLGFLGKKGGFSSKKPQEKNKGKEGKEKRKATGNSRVCRWQYKLCFFGICGKQFRTSILVQKVGGLPEEWNGFKITEWVRSWKISGVGWKRHVSFPNKKKGEKSENQKSQETNKQTKNPIFFFFFFTSDGMEGKKTDFNRDYDLGL